MRNAASFPHFHWTDLVQLSENWAKRNNSLVDRTFPSSVSLDSLEILYKPVLKHTNLFSFSFLSQNVQFFTKYCHNKENRNIYDDVTAAQLWGLGFGSVSGHGLHCFSEKLFGNSKQLSSCLSGHTNVSRLQICKYIPILTFLLSIVCRLMFCNRSRR